ncbi:hypothetical protein [Paenibacillus segetis]|uniref:Uncharacterized protein n=1 Tax=Paenibacillus segetis TaxID=1325360 RepID=A0ABQ1Y6Z0_9BACL|nr:hypothetical protein [Paenibacillus segetis]GGH14029.1 hypothetical protein GCM10008013_07470 [Paenibacillus segetis]
MRQISYIMIATLRAPFDLSIAVVVGLSHFYNTLQGYNPTTKANASASPDSSGPLC